MGEELTLGEVCGRHTEFLCRREPHSVGNRTDRTTPLTEAICGGLNAHFGETERSENGFGTVQIALDGAQGIRV